MPAVTPGESVTWINVISLNRREKIARWWIENVRKQQTYSSPRQREQAFQTQISVVDIDNLASDGLKAALHKQRQEHEMGASFVSFPRATPDGSQYFGSILIPRKPLNVTFTEQEVEPISNED